jgi:ADP-ribosylglycohydrolase
MTLEKAIIGCILGTAVGDALGLPYEGLGPLRGKKLLGQPDRHRLLFGHGMVSDDTEHTMYVVRSLVTSKFNPDQFERHLARSLRWWLAGLPAGVGFATLRAVFKLWIGVAPDRSGVFSAGNGPAMRSAVLGIAFGEDPEVLTDWVLRSTRITHSDPKAFFGAFTVALAAHLSSLSRNVLPQHFVRIVTTSLAKYESTEFVKLVNKAATSAQNNQSVGDFAESLGSRSGISGYMYHTVPCVIQTWLRYQEDFVGGLQEILCAGGDTDTTGAILGAILGARAGKDGIPEEWRTRIIEWPRTITWMEQMGHCLAASLSGDLKTACPGYFVPGVVLRNLIFLKVVIFHGLRRLAPPY